MKKVITSIVLIASVLVACSGTPSAPVFQQSTPTQETILATSISATPDISLDHEKILIVNKRNYYIANPDGSESVLLYSAEQEPLEMASLSPNKTKFAYFKNNFLYILDLESKATAVLNKDIIGSIGGRLRWSPDGKKLAMTCSTPQPINAICLIDVQNGQIEFLLSQNNAGEFCSKNYMEFLDWSKDGTTMIYTCFMVPEKGQKQIFAIYLYDTASGDSSQIFDNTSQNAIWYLHTVSLSPQNNYLLVNGADQNPTDQVFLIDLTTSALIQLTNGSEYHSAAFAWRSDGNSFYLNKTLVQNPYTESNFVMNINGEILFSIEVDGAIIE